MRLSKYMLAVVFALNGAINISYTHTTPPSPHQEIVTRINEARRQAAEASKQVRKEAKSALKHENRENLSLWAQLGLNTRLWQQAAENWLIETQSAGEWAGEDTLQKARDEVQEATELRQSTEHFIELLGTKLDMQARADAALTTVYQEYVEGNPISHEILENTLNTLANILHQYPAATRPPELNTAFRAAEIALQISPLIAQSLMIPQRRRLIELLDDVTLFMTINENQLSDKERRALELAIQVADIAAQAYQNKRSPDRSQLERSSRRALKIAQELQKAPFIQ